MCICTRHVNIPISTLGSFQNLIYSPNWYQLSSFCNYRALVLRGVNTFQLLFYIQNFKNIAPFGYGFLKNFGTCEQLVLIYRTNCSLECKKNTIILIEKGEERKKKWKRRERNMIFYIIWCFSLYYFNEIYIKIKTKMLGEL